LAGSNVNIAPERSEIEVSLFGPGYGESIVLHLGENLWLIVDSCLDPLTGDPAPLTYLHHLHIDLATAVRWVVATHWHDDHIRGLGRIMQVCESAEFVCSAALKHQDFLTLVTAYGHYSMMESPPVQEFYEILQALAAQGQQRPGTRPRPPTLATSSRCIWQSNMEVSGVNYPCSIYTLSPSDASIVLAHSHLATLMPQLKTTKLRIPALTPNYTAVVLWVNIGAVFILLGSDLEESGHPDTGWSVILGSRTYPPGKASIFKVPHHGSHTGHHPQVWQDMLDTAPVAILTPFALGNVSLPTPQDVERICQRTEQAYATAMPRRRRRRGRPQVVEKLMRDTVGSSIREVYSSTGHIRLRANLAETPLAWRVELFGDACPLRNIYR